MNQQTLTKGYTLRQYQQDAVDSTLNHFRSSHDPAVIVLPTGAGKSLVIAELSRLAKGKVLCLAHVKELVQQNHQKFCLTGQQAGIYSAGLQQKQALLPVTFASIQSVFYNLDDFRQPISLLIIDECHRVNVESNSENGGQYQQVIQLLKKTNPKLKILGLTATPFRLESGWIYQKHYHGFQRGDAHAFFKRCIYELPLRYMIKNGYLTPPKIEDAAISNYNFSDIQTDRFGNTNEDDLNQLIGKYPRVTQAITEQIQTLCHERKACMIFAATVKHAQEIISYLPADQAQLITGATSVRNRDNIIDAFKQESFKYLVNVSVLTTGFDAPHVDFIAILRPTQSISLYQQIVGRGLRLSPNKKDCLVIDYAGNGYDLYTPEIGSKRPSTNSEPVLVECPQCHFQNTFWGQKDSEGHLIEHYGRRCHALLDTPHGEEQCDYRFRFKLCSHCQAENDIAAKVCQSCQQDLIDPDDLLKKALNLKEAKVIRCSGIKAEISDSNITITYFDEDGDELTEAFNFSHAKRKHDFLYEFVRRIAHGTVNIQIDSLSDLAPFLPYLPHPDFVIARTDKQAGRKQKIPKWKVTERLFDYQGPYRKANQLSVHSTKK
ncbi:DEAD/DEAH box helicase [Marinomonas agarivorans]|nr:DEAD/DEAH box helicase [Marinomonas agarivorans]